MTKMGFHCFHLVSQSPWPVVGSLSVGSGIVSVYLYLSGLLGGLTCSLVVMTVSLVMVQWWRDVSRESLLEGDHTIKVSNGLKLGMVMFIMSEVLFFFSFFFGFFFIELGPPVEYSLLWPPKGIQAVSWMEAPLLNTLILLSSGISITWAHHALLESHYFHARSGMAMTVFLGLLFTWFQYEEYKECSFTISDGFFGSIFFVGTGFHGIHVIIGSIFIVVSWVRMETMKVHESGHTSFEMAAWYWHFVDVVWLFLFISMYYL
nr:cytochrome c oxidase subunit 3 [Craspedonirmus immer]